MGHWCSYHIFISVIFRGITQPRRRRWRHRDLKKMERFSEQNNNSARASHLLLHFGAFTARLRHEIPNSMFYVGQKHKTMIFSFFLNLDMVLENSIPEKFAYLWQVNRNVIFAMRFGKQRELTLSVKSFRCCRRRGCVIFVITEKSPGKMEYLLFYALFLCN